MAPVILAVIILIICSPASLAAGCGVYDHAGLFNGGEYEALLEKAPKPKRSPLKLIS